MKSILITALILTSAFASSKDKGIGIIFLTPKVNEEVTINIYDKCSIKSLLLGSFICQDKASEGYFKYSVVCKDLTKNNLIDYAYEKRGLPICEINGKWLMVIFGYDKFNKPLKGWVESKEGSTDYFLWKDILIKKYLYFESDLIIFYDNPNGTKVEFKLEPSENRKYDYVMRPIEVIDNWMKVEVTTPSDSCNKPEKKEKKVFWIKYLDDRGRPLVWYFTRGC